MSSLPLPENNNISKDKKVNKILDNYFVKELSFPSNEVDAVVSFFEKRDFSKTAAIATATVLLNQAKIDGVKIFTLLDTLKGLEDLQLSAVVTEILNYSRLRTSILGYKITEPEDKLERRNIVL
jgi:hypothetical protein